MSAFRYLCFPTLAPATVLLLLFVPESAAYAQYGTYGEMGRPAEQPPSKQIKSMAEIERRLEQVLELLPLALPAADLQDERQVLINFYDQISARAGGEKISMSGYSSAPENTGRDNLANLNSRRQELERIHALRQKNIERRIELIKLKIQHAEIMRDDIHAATTPASPNRP